MFKLVLDACPIRQVVYSEIIFMENPRNSYDYEQFGMYMIKIRCIMGRDIYNVWKLT